jgi:hypothetical protein
VRFGDEGGLLRFGRVKNPRELSIKIELDRGGIWERLSGVFDGVQFDPESRGDSVDGCLPTGSTFDGSAEIVPAPVKMASRWHFAVIGELEWLPWVDPKLLEQGDDFRWISLLSDQGKVSTRIATAPLCRNLIRLLIARARVLHINSEVPRPKGNSLTGFVHTALIVADGVNGRVQSSCRGMVMMIHDARVPEKTMLHLPPMVPSQRASRTTPTRVQ